MTELMTGDKARWEVLWVKKRKNGKLAVIVKEFENDFGGALALYTKAKLAGKPFATLRCCNVGFPPPERYRPQYKTVKTKKYSIVKRKGKRYKKYKTKTVWVEPMSAVNVKGWWWCPYCREMRKFVTWKGFTIEGQFVPQEGVHCQICEVSHRDHHVRKWNPQAQMLEFRIGKRRSNGRGKRKRSRKAR